MPALIAGGSGVKVPYVSKMETTAYFIQRKCCFSKPIKKQTLRVSGHVRARGTLGNLGNILATFGKFPCSMHTTRARLFYGLCFCSLLVEHCIYSCIYSKLHNLEFAATMQLHLDHYTHINTFKTLSKTVLKHQKLIFKNQSQASSKKHKALKLKKSTH